MFVSKYQKRLIETRKLGWRDGYLENEDTKLGEMGGSLADEAAGEAGSSGEEAGAGENGDKAAAAAMASAANIAAATIAAVGCSDGNHGH